VPGGMLIFESTGRRSRFGGPGRLQHKAAFLEAPPRYSKVSVPSGFPGGEHHRSHHQYRSPAGPGTLPLTNRNFPPNNGWGSPRPLPPAAAVQKTAAAFTFEGFLPGAGRPRRIQAPGRVPFRPAGSAPARGLVRESPQAMGIRVSGRSCQGGTSAAGRVTCGRTVPSRSDPARPGARVAGRPGIHGFRKNLSVFRSFGGVSLRRPPQEGSRARSRR
jgi:hypothetical protein